MPRIAIQLHADFIAQVCQMVGVEENTSIFGDSAYAVVEVVGVDPIEFNMKLVNEDEIFEQAAADPELEILSM
jgi:hypothetical protein